MEPNDLINEDMLKVSYWEQLMNKLFQLTITKGIDIAVSILILFVGFFIIGKIAKGIRLAITKRTEDVAVAAFVEQCVRIVMKIMLVLSVATQMGIETTSFVAALGAAGLAIGMALQGSLSNFAGGVLILVFKPFRAGDSVESLGYAGTVVRIDIFHTILLTSDNKTVVLPNGQVANSSLVNTTKQEKRRSEFQVNISYSEDIQRVRRVILDAVSRNEKILKTPEPVVLVNNLGDANINLIIRFWTVTGEHSVALAQAMESVKLAFDKEGIVIPAGPQKIQILQGPAK